MIKNIIIFGELINNIQNHRLQNISFSKNKCVPLNEYINFSIHTCKLYPDIVSSKPSYGDKLLMEYNSHHYNHSVYQTMSRETLGN